MMRVMRVFLKDGCRIYQFDFIFVILIVGTSLHKSNMTNNAEEKGRK